MDLTSIIGDNMDISMRHYITTEDLFKIGLFVFFAVFLAILAGIIIKKVV